MQTVYIFNGLVRREFLSYGFKQTDTGLLNITVRKIDIFYHWL